MIGQQFGHGEDKNTAAQLVSHVILAATLAYINGGDPTAGGSAAVASEAAANYLTNQLAEKYKDELTEQLFNSLAKQNGFTVIKGGKYGSNNGFDHVWVAKDGSVTILSDSKQITNGTVKLSSNAAGGNTQLSKSESLGPYPVLSLKKAREIAYELKYKYSKAEQLDELKPLFREVGEDWFNNQKIGGRINIF